MKRSNQSNLPAGVDEITALKLKIAELERQASANNPSPVEMSEEDTRIRPDEYIRVMSLLHYTLILSTKSGGQGNSRTFRRFGEVSEILYSELVEMLNNHPNFVESGYFYILDKRVIRRHGLDGLYSTLLDKERLEKIMQADSDDCVSLFKAGNSKQQETILEYLVDKVRQDPLGVNLNVIDKISRASGVNIVKRAEDSKLIDEPED